MLVLNENDFEILKRAEDMLDTTFDWQIKDDEMTGLVNEDAFSIIDDLCTEIDMLKEQLDDQKEHYEELIRECYEPISKYEFYGVSENDFH